MKTKQTTMDSRDLNDILISRFNSEWNGKVREIPFSEVLKKRGEPLNINNGFRLKNASKHSENLALANIGIIQLVEYLNNHIEITNRDFKALQSRLNAQESNPLIDISQPIYITRINAEILAYLIKTILDKIIVLLGQLTDTKNIDSVGTLLKDDKISNFCDGTFIRFKEFLYEINKIHNAYKHTFSNLQLINIVSQIEPTMFNIYKPSNSTRNPTEIGHMICSNAIDSFNGFLFSAKEYTLKISFKDTD